MISRNSVFNSEKIRHNRFFRKKPCPDVRKANLLSCEKDFVRFILLSPFPDQVIGGLGNFQSFPLILKKLSKKPRNSRRLSTNQRDVKSDVGIEERGDM